MSAPVQLVHRGPVPSLAEREIMLANLRCAVARVRQIAEELSLVGIVLKHGTIDITQARDWADEIAPGVLPTVEQSAFPFKVALP
jgi:hypothetical protein